MLTTVNLVITFYIKQPPCAFHLLPTVGGSLLEIYFNKKNACIFTYIQRMRNGALE